MQSSKGSAAHAPTSGAFNSPRPFKSLTTDTLLLDSPDGQQSLNNMYSVLRTMAVLERLAVCMSGWPPAHKATDHVYKLPSIETAVHYLHNTTSFPTKAT